MTPHQEKSKAVHGILLFNKSKGISSNLALQKVKRLFGAKKAGHAGSLDPLATGMLPICLGEATKVCHYLLHADKCYETTALLGIKTSTGDAMGEVKAVVQEFCITPSQFLQVLNQFKGKSWQIPSMYSALKHKGRPLYSYARQGIEIERAPREISIDFLQLEAFDGKQFKLQVCCSKGTYIRNLVEDIGDVLAVGAHVTALHRTYTAGFAGKTMYSLEELVSMSESERLHCLIPMDSAIDYLRPFILSAEEVLALRQGRLLHRGMETERIQVVRLYDEQLQFIGLGEQLVNGDLKAKRLLSFEASYL